MYTVEAILDKKYIPSEKSDYYLIKWKGYDIGQCSWEPFTHLRQNCQELIHKFEKKYGHYKTTQIGKVWLNTYSNQHEHQKGQIAVKKSRNTLKISKIKPNKTKSEVKEQLNIQYADSEEPSYYNEHKVLQNSKKQQRQSLHSKSIIQQQNFSHHTPRSKDSIKDMQNLHRRNSIDKFNVQRSCFQVVKPSSSRVEDFQYTQRSQSHRQVGEALHDLNTQFAPIVLTSKRSESKFPQQQREETKIDIIGMRKKDQKLQFFVVKNNKADWISHEEIFDNYSKDLCRYYQRYIKID